jgi:PAP2 superfamily C-terminal
MRRFDDIIRGFSDRAFLESLLLGVLAILLSLVSVHYSAVYATNAASNHVTDIILSNVPAYDVSILFTWGAFVAVLFSIFVVIFLKFRAAPYILKSAALLLIIRSIFVSLTHISPYPTKITLSPYFLSSTTLAQMFFTGDDLFFSGHVGLTYLMALLLWETPWLRYTYLALSVMFAIVVLLGHLHYSIDVFAAYFITYTIYIISMRMFKADYARATPTLEKAA